MPVRPAEAALTPLAGPRDALPQGRTAHALVLTYKFSLMEDGKVTPMLPMLNRRDPHSLHGIMTAPSRARRWKIVTAS